MRHRRRDFKISARLAGDHIASVVVKLQFRFESTEMRNVAS